MRASLLGLLVITVSACSEARPEDLELHGMGEYHLLGGREVWHLEVLAPAAPSEIRVEYGTASGPLNEQRGILTAAAQVRLDEALIHLADHWDSDLSQCRDDCWDFVSYGVTDRDGRSIGGQYSTPPAAFAPLDSLGRDVTHELSGCGPRVLTEPSPACLD